MKRNNWLLIVCFICSASCASSQSKIRKIKLEYVSFDLETDAHVHCKEFEESFKNQIKRRYIEDTRMLERLTYYLKVVQAHRANINPDVRAKIYIYNKSGSVDTLCISKFALSLNGKVYTVSGGFISFIKKLESTR